MRCDRMGGGTLTDWLAVCSHVLRTVGGRESEGAGPGLGRLGSGRREGGGGGTERVKEGEKE